MYLMIKKCITIVACFFLMAQNAHAQTTLLIEAVKNNDFQNVKQYIRNGADVNAYTDDSDNVIVHAVTYASVECVQLLLQHKADPNLRNKYGQTAIMLCTHDIEKMKLLLQYGADINAASKSGNTALMIASMAYGQYETVKWLIDNGADPMVKRWGAETALMRAAQFGDSMTVKLLLSKGLEIDAHPWGYTSLMYATRMANWPCVLTLLHNGADPNISDQVNMLPVSWAAELNNLEVVQAMLAKTKDINAVDSLAGMTPLMWATYNEYDNTEIIQALLDKGAQVNIKARNGSTALSWAMKKGNTATVALLRKAGATE